MASQALMTSKTTIGAVAGVPVSGPCTIHVNGTSVFSDNTKIDIETAVAVTAGHFVPYMKEHEKLTIKAAEGPYKIDVTGAYHVRGVVRGTGSGHYQITMKPVVIRGL